MRNNSKLKGNKKGTSGSNDPSETIKRIDNLKTKIKTTQVKNISSNKKMANIWFGGIVAIMFLFLIFSLGNNNQVEDIQQIGEPVDAKILDNLQATVYKSPTCGCCHLWIEYMQQNTKMKFETVDIEDVSPIKVQNGVPEDLSSCHTVLVGNYVVEGHVPYQAIVKLFQQKPSIVGIAVAGMPDGSPGMGGSGSFTAMSFDNQGNSATFMEF